MFVAIVQIIIFIWYMVYCHRKTKTILPSISDSWYLLQPFAKEHFFARFCGVLGVTMFMHCKPPFADMTHLCFALSGLFVAAVAMAPNFSDKIRKITIMHFTFAGISIIMGAIGVCITWPILWWWLLGVLAVIIPIALSKLFWKIALIEYISFAFIIISIILIYGNF